MFRKNLTYNQDGASRSVALQSEDGFSWSVAGSETSNEDTGFGHASIGGRHFVLQSKGNGLQVLAETNTPTKAARIAEAL